MTEQRYDFIPLPAGVRREERPAARLDVRLPGRLFGQILVEYECEQPVHVGSGFKDLRGNVVVRLGVRSGGSLVIPGSTCKGMLRARYEAITKSCALFHPAGFPNRSVRSASRSHPQVGFARLSPEMERHDILQRLCKPGDRGRLCPACGLFGCQSGRQGLRSRVSVGDLTVVGGTEAVIEPIAAQYGPRLHHIGAARVQQTRDGQQFVVESLHGRKFARGAQRVQAGEPSLAVESIPARARLRGQWRLFGLDPAELGGLLCAGGFMPSSSLKVGAGKGYGFGRIRPVRIELSLVDERRAAIETAADVYRAAFEASPDRHGPGVERLLAIHNSPQL